MKKILLFASAVLFSMMSFAGTQEILPSAYDGKGGESGIGGEATAVVGDITISSTLAYNKSNEHIREYANSVITISSSKTITKIEITCTASGDAKYGPGKLTADGYSAGTWTGSATSVEFTATAQVRWTKIVVTYDGEGGSTPETPEEPEEPETPVEPEEPETPAVPEGAITCAEAVAICQKTGTTSTTEKYTIRGYVTEVKEAYNSQYGNATYWMADEKGGGKQLQAYRVKPVNTSDQAVKLNDYVEVVGTLVNFYGNTPEVNAGGTYTIITAADGGETPEEPEEPETPVEPGETTIEIPAEAAAWDIPAEAIDVLQARAICAALQPGQNTGKKYYVMGYVKRLSSKHAEAVEKYKNARFYMENVKGGNSDEEFVAFQVKGIDGGDITNPDVVATGDFVIVYGELTHFKYDANSDSDYETVGGGKAYIWKSTNPLLADTESGVEDVIVNEKMTKVIKNGKMYIIRDGKAYNVLGAQL